MGVYRSRIPRRPFVSGPFNPITKRWYIYIITSIIGALTSVYQYTLCDGYKKQLSCGWWTMRRTIPICTYDRSERINMLLSRVYYCNRTRAQIIIYKYRTIVIDRMLKNGLPRGRDIRYKLRTLKACECFRSFQSPSRNYAFISCD